LATDTEVDAFLARNGQGPQHEALRRLIVTTSAIADAARDELRRTGVSKGNKITAAQIRAGRGLLGWSQDQLAHESNLNPSDVAICESGRDTPLVEHLERIAATLGMAGIVLIGEGELTAGGPGIRMGALGTSTGQPVIRHDLEGNDNDRPTASSGHRINE
jgi:DNA-binding transcriptional regulator YiaG